MKTATNGRDRGGVILVSPNGEHRQSLKEAVRAQSAVILSEWTQYPAADQLSQVITPICDALLVDVDTDSRVALDLVEAVCRQQPWVTVIVYSKTTQQDLLVRSMRAGAREFLSGEIAPGVLSEALERGAARRAEYGKERASGKVLVFWGAKGGSGVTTLAVNFAVALCEETGGEAALLDLNPQLGDVAVLLGLTPRFTIAEAFQNADRLDKEFVNGLAVPYRAGLSVIAAPDSYVAARNVEGRTVDRLLDLLRGRFPYVVVDAGLGLGTAAGRLFQVSTTIYLVTQADIPALRNCERYLSHFREYPGLPVELVINRYHHAQNEFDDQRIQEALGIPPKWKVPNDYATAHRASNAGTPLVLTHSAAAKILRLMACEASGKPCETQRRKKFRLFG